MKVYCTLFDSFYLSRAMVMYESLRHSGGEFHLYIFAFDHESFRILRSMQLANVTVVHLDDFETDELRRVKVTRSTAEYCWTCTPSTISYVIEKFGEKECTYIDADLYFFSDPAVLIDELDENSKNVLISEHRYSFLPKLYEQQRSGKFCVQFMTFRNQESSLKVLNRWKEQCIEWCYAKHEEGKFGDQKYLDVWPEMYENVHILRNQGGGLAPWNINNYRLFKDQPGSLFMDKRSGVTFRPVFYHFQYVKSLGKGTYDIGWYNIPDEIRRNLYIPYLAALEKTESVLMTDSVYIRRYSKMKSYLSGNPLKVLLKSVFSYNLLKV